MLARGDPYVTEFGRDRTGVAGEAQGLPGENGSADGNQPPTSLWPTMRKGPPWGGKDERVEVTGRRIQRHPSGEAVSPVRRSRNVTRQTEPNSSRSGPPGTRTRNLRIKSPLLCQIELEARRRISIPRRAPSSSGRLLPAVDVAVVEIRQPRVHALEILHQLRAPAVPLADRPGEMFFALTDLGFDGRGGE